MIKMTKDQQPNVETSTKCSEAEVTAPGLALVGAAIIVAAVLEAVEVASVAVAEVLGAAGVALEATVEAGLVAASTTEAAEASIAADLEAKEGDLEGVAVVDLEIEDMGGVAIRITLNVNCVYVTVL